jgi:hypothetical protein
MKAMTNLRLPPRKALAFIAALACFPGFLVHASALSGQSVKILAASYSFGSDYADVTGRVSDLLQSDAPFQANPECLHVDPHPGWNKALVIVCEVDGKRAIFSVGEGENVSRELLREKARIIPEPLKVLAASYSFGSDYADVTPRVRDLLKSDETFQANPGCLHVDPHPYWNKALIIFCEVDGKRAIFSVGENEDVSRALVREKARILAPELPETPAAGQAVF